jgi:hypothetical protein
MLRNVEKQANELGLGGWPHANEHELKYSYLTPPCFVDPSIDWVWSHYKVMWNYSANTGTFNALMPIRDLNSPERNPYVRSDVCEVVYISDVFGTPKLSKIGVRLNWPHRSVLVIKPPPGFPIFIDSRDSFVFEEEVDGLTEGRFVFHPKMGLAIGGVRFETRNEHLRALQAEQDEGEMGDSLGHTGVCSGIFVENIKSARSFDGYLWIHSESRLFAFPINGIEPRHMKYLKKFINQ